MKTVEVEIKGISPLLINRFKESDEIQDGLRTTKKKDYGSPRAQAELTAYQDADKVLWIPSMWVKGALATVAGDYRLPSSKKSVKSVIGGAVIPLNEKLYFSEKYTIKDIEIDSRPCVVMRARIMRHRAKLEQWTLRFYLEIDEEILDTENLHQILSSAGRRAGLGDFRVSKGGPYGRFIVSFWKVLKKKKV